MIQSSIIERVSILLRALQSDPIFTWDRLGSWDARRSQESRIKTDPIPVRSLACRDRTEPISSLDRIGGSQDRTGPDWIGSFA
jgi:hypothetical protein